MKFKAITISTILCVLLFLFVSYKFYLKNNLPNSFTIRLVKDNTSSGAGRVHTINLKYRNNILIEGTRTYDMGNYQTSLHQKCVAVDSSWIDFYTGDTCTINNISYFRYTDDTKGGSIGNSTEPAFTTPPSKKELEYRIRKGDIAPLGTRACDRFMICYELEK